MSAPTEIDLLRELRADVDRWRDAGGDVRDLSYMLDTLGKLDKHFPNNEDDRDPMEWPDVETWQFTDYCIDRLTEGRTRLRVKERGKLEVILRRYRKHVFGSAQTEKEQKAARGPADEPRDVVAESKARLGQRIDEGVAEEH